MIAAPAALALRRVAPVGVAPPLVVHALRPVVHGLAAKDEGPAQFATGTTSGAAV